MGSDYLSTGELAALGAAFLWTMSSMFWGRVQLSPLGMNLAKNAVGGTLLFLHLAVLALISQTPLFNASWNSLGWLSLSGLVGIVIGDTLFFRSLQILGPRLALMVATTSPLFSVFIGLLILGEVLTLPVLFGVVTTITGIVIVILDRKARTEAPGLYPGSRWVGLFCGLGGALCQSVGGAFSKLGMTECEPLEATLIRTAIALGCTVLLAAGQRRLRLIVNRILEPQSLKAILPAAAMGTWIGIWLSQVAFAQSSLAAATTLMATSPIFALPIAHFYLKQPATWVAVVGSLVGIIGIYFVARERERLQQGHAVITPIETTWSLPKTGEAPFGRRQILLSERRWISAVPPILDPQPVAPGKPLVP